MVRLRRKDLFPSPDEPIKATTTPFEYLSSDYQNSFDLKGFA